jgi:hypothetical protein
MAKLSTKFDLGDLVWKIDRSNEVLTVPCRFCRGERWLRVESEGGDASKGVPCPECKGAGKVDLGTWPVWKVYTGQMRIGKIEVVLYDHTVERGEHAVPIRDAEKYMAVETGLGSGSVHDAEDLFADRDLAEKEAEARTERTRRGEKIGPWTAWWPSVQQVGVAQGFLDHRDVYEYNQGHVLLAEAIVAAASAETRT